MIIHTGRLEGTLKASSTPVISAELSKMVGCRLRMYFCMTYSKKRHASTEVSVTMRAAHAEEQYGTDKCRNKRYEYPVHVPLYGIATVDVWRR